MMSKGKSFGVYRNFLTVEGSRSIVWKQALKSKYLSGSDNKKFTYNKGDRGFVEREMATHSHILT